MPADLLSPERVIVGCRAGSKKELFQELARVAAEAVGRHEREIFDALWQRERLAATGIGRGVAIPHAKVAGLKGVMGVFARLADAIDYDAPDGQAVDLVFLLLAPEGAGADHLRALARVSQALRDPAARERLRQAEDAENLSAVLTEVAGSQPA